MDGFCGSDRILGAVSCLWRCFGRWAVFALVGHRRLETVELITSCCCCHDPEQIKAKPGEDVPLQCRGSKDDEIVMSRWSRPDLESEHYLFYIKNNRILKHFQHESFRGRVELRDPEMKDGDFSVILKNVRINDTGSYECYVGTNGNKPKLINNISLKVEDSGHTGGHKGGGDQDKGDKGGGDQGGPVGLAVGLTVVGILLLVAAVVGFMFYRKRCRPTDQNPNPPPEQIPMNPR